MVIVLIYYFLLSKFKKTSTAIATKKNNTKLIKEISVIHVSAVN